MIDRNIVASIENYIKYNNGYKLLSSNLNNILDTINLSNFRLFGNNNIVNNYSIDNLKEDSVLYFKEVDRIVDYFASLVDRLKELFNKIDYYKNKIKDTSSRLKSSVNNFWHNVTTGADWGDVELHLALRFVSFGSKFPPKKLWNAFKDLIDIIKSSFDLFVVISDFLIYLCEFVENEINKIKEMIL